jgi:predicted transcriptional regulator
LKKTLAIKLDDKLKRSFKAKVKSSGQTLEYVVGQLIADYVTRKR